MASGLAMGSPGPAMPTTVMRGSFSSTFSMYTTACSGESTALVTPGRDSLTQSYLRLQKLHMMLHLGATGRCTRPQEPADSRLKQGCLERSFWVVMAGSF
ncbi:hypothetical protein DSECCO2_591620 [anaerobic digester metagenome]